MKINILIILILTNLLLSGCSTTDHSHLNDNKHPIVAFVDDQTLAIHVANAISHEKELWNNSHISVLSHNNAILLVGQTPSLELKQQAEKVVSNLPEVTTLYNQLVISNPSFLYDRTMDTWITTQAKAKLLAERHLASYNIKVITENGTVYLMGNPKETEKNTAINIVRNIAGVKNVVDVFNDEQPTYVE